MKDHVFCSSTEKMSQTHVHTALRCGTQAPLCSFTAPLLPITRKWSSPGADFDTLAATEARGPTRGGGGASSVYLPSFASGHTSCTVNTDMIGESQP